MRQRREVARCAHRTLERNVRVDLGIDQRNEGVDHLAPDAGEATGQAVDLEQHDRTDHGVTQRLAHTGGVGQDQGALELFQVRRSDTGGGQQAETGVDAVGGTALGENALDAGHAGGDGCIGGRVQGQADGLVIGRAQLGQVQLAGNEVQCSHDQTSLPVIIGRFRPCSLAQSMAIW
ncbi:hypothetical protein D3C78_1217690 [compost metagenome]